MFTELEFKNEWYNNQLDINNYISSGAIESYVLGLATPEEITELETMADTYPEVKQALNDFEEMLEQQALSNAVPPPDFVKSKVMAALENEGLEKSLIPIMDGLNADPKSQAKVIPITTAPKSIKWLQSAIAASVILLLGSAILNFYFYSQYRHYSEEYKTLLAQNTTLTAKADALEASYKMVKSPDVKLVAMKGVPAKPEALATVYWDNHTKDVWLMINNLPQNPSDKQYQLWAIVNGKPVDAGMINLDQQDVLVKMTHIPNAQAFAITLEKKGGSASPTMDQMYVFGKI